MSDHRAIVSLSQCLQLAGQGAELDGGPWTDQQWMHDRLATSDRCLTLFPLAAGVHQVEVFVHPRRPDFNNQRSDDDWAHVVEGAWTPPEDVVSVPQLLGNEGTFDVQLPAEPCRVCWRLGWFDPQRVDDEAPWGALRSELHVWPARPEPVEVRKLWDGKTPPLPELPPRRESAFFSLMAVGALFTIMITIVVVIPAGFVWLLWLGIKFALEAFGVW